METKNVIYVCGYESPCGTLLLGSYRRRLCLCDWAAEKHHARVVGRLRRLLEAETVTATSETIAEAMRQLDEYFARKRKTFETDLLFCGTDFQKSVWDELLKIPYGTTLSYGEMARRIGHPKAVRAVANANGANALSIFAPCHRVIGSDGTLTGYGGGLAAKRKLLEVEGVL